jgi:hypothetical protein
MLERLSRYRLGVAIFLIAVALVVGMVGCASSSPTVQIRTWSDLNGIRDKAANYVLMNDLDSTTPGYEELASPTADGGQGWQPIGSFNDAWYGSFDGQGHVIRDLFIDRPAERDVGLFGGVLNWTMIKNVEVTGATVTGQSYVGILVGTNYGTVSSCYSSGDVTGDEYVGVLVGGSGNTSTISNCFSVGSAHGGTVVGGLLGGNTGTVSDSYSLASAVGDSQVGGFIGGNGGTASNCYSAGSVGGNDDIGGLVGADFDGTVTNSFWDTQTSGQATSGGGTGKTTAQMHDIATFSGAGWNIIAVASTGTRNTSYIWNIVNGATNPFMSWQP